LIKKNIFRFKKEGIKKKKHLINEMRSMIIKTAIKSGSVKASSKLYAFMLRTKKINKRKSISYQTTLCMETGHYKSRLNWGKLSRYSFKSSANKDTFPFLMKKTK